MSDNKKYYYMKLKENFFDSDEMIILETMQDGYLYSNILLKLYLRSLKDNGRLMFKGVIPYTPDVLSKVLRHNVGVVEKAIQIFKQLGLVEILDNGAIYMLDIQNFIGKSSTEADRIRDYRKKVDEQKLISATDDVTKSVQMYVQKYDKSTPEKELDIEKEKDTTTSAEIELQRVAKSYYDIHQHELKPRDWPEMTKAVKEYGADHIISVMQAKSLSASGDVTTFRYYLSAIKEKSEDTMNRRRKGNNTYYTSPSELEAQQAARMAEMRKQDIPMKYDPTF